MLNLCFILLFWQSLSILNSSKYLEKIRQVNEHKYMNLDILFSQRFTKIKIWIFHSFIFLTKQIFVVKKIAFLKMKHFSWKLLHINLIKLS